ncbi:hypothetical protein IGI04_004096 [Brassica rapa subsp. trilocularis]|uniref:NAC domain-containing protein n=1 Tax=Brassica rapa subsp. trilocularis TaxID=1813537 RepID=A0ABQ7P0D9_BRACM|nr:hypothetical protein IGI04_004096 [Brassica rapa subsp. trilocularis]
MISKDPRSSLPPGFRFHPTDEELILHYLRKKVSSLPVPLSIIADVDIYKSDPWDLPAKAPFGEKEWYFFSPRDRKYPNGARPNRAAASGYWKATGTDKLIAVPNREGFNENIGIKKALVFYTGKPPKGVKTNWIMHEYRLAESLSPKRVAHARNGSQVNNLGDRTLKSTEYSMRLDDWVLCRIYKKSHASLSSPEVASATSEDQEHEENDNEPFVVSETLLPNLANDQTLKRQQSSFSNLLDATDLTFLTNFLNETPENRTESEFSFLFGDFSNPDIYGNRYLGHKLPQLSSPTSETRVIGNKRERVDYAEEMMNNSKKINNFSYNNSIDHLDHSLIQQSSFLNQELLIKIAKMGEKEFYFFCQRDRKYPTGMRTNRATLSGYWKATGKDKEIFRGKGCFVGMKKTLVFYRGRAPKGEKTNWVMHEYRLDGIYSYHNLPKTARDEWVVCRVFHKNAPPPTTTATTTTTNQLTRIDSLDNIDHLLDFSSLPPLIDPGFLSQPGPSFSGAGQQHDFKPIPHHPTTVQINNTYPSAQTLTYPYNSVPNYGFGSGYGTGSGNNNNGMIKLENSLVSVSQETGLSSDVNTTATPEISSSYPGMVNTAANAAMMDGNKTSYDDDDLGIFWDDY